MDTDKISFIAERNNHGASLLQNGMYADTIKTLVEALTSLRACVDHTKTSCDNEETTSCHPFDSSISMQDINMNIAASSTGDIYPVQMYNRFIVLDFQEDDDIVSFHEATEAILMFNLAMATHCFEIYTGKSQALEESLNLYRFAFMKVQSVIDRTKNGDHSVIYPLHVVRLGIMNNMTHIYSQRNDIYTTEICLNEFARAIVSMPFYPKLLGEKLCSTHWITSTVNATKGAPVA